MFDERENPRANHALRVGLCDLPTPQVSADFDRRIQATLLDGASSGLGRSARPAALVANWWTACRQALPAGVCTLAAALLLLHLMQRVPVGLPLAVPAGSAPAASQELAYRRAVDAPRDALDDIDLDRASLGLFHRSARISANKSG